MVSPLGRLLNGVSILIYKYVHNNVLIDPVPVDIDSAFIVITTTSHYVNVITPTMIGWIAIATLVKVK